MDTCKATACFLVLMVLCKASLAQEPLRENDFNIDAVTGPILGSNRIVGMGGAYTPLADGINAAAWNPASFGSRYLFELDWFEWDPAFSLFAPGVFGQKDFFNNGAGMEADAFFFFNFGLRLQFGRFGLGLDGRVHTLRTTVGEETIDILMLEGHLGFAYGFMDGQLVLGIGVRGADLDMELPGEDPLVHFTGAGLEVGALLRLADRPWRLGVAGRLPVDSRAEPGPGEEVIDGVRTVRGFVLPNRVYMPWQVQLGFAWQFGDRPLNLRWVDPHDPEEQLEQEMKQKWCRRAAEQLRREMQAAGRPRPREPLCPDLPEEPQDEAWWEQEERLREAEEEAMETEVEEAEERTDRRRRKVYEALSRTYCLVSAEVLLIGTTEDGIGLDAFLEQERRRAGEDLSVGLRLGAEFEPIPGWLKARAGFYLEPPRTPSAGHRPHATAGIDFRLFRWDVFGAFDPFEVQIGLSADLAPRYVDVGLGIGFWH